MCVTCLHMSLPCIAATCLHVTRIHAHKLCMPTRIRVYRYFFAVPGARALVSALVPGVPFLPPRMAAQQGPIDVCRVWMGNLLADIDADTVWTVLEEWGVSTEGITEVAPFPRPKTAQGMSNDSSCVVTFLA